jgi:hypothetical protein
VFSENLLALPQFQQLRNRGPQWILPPYVRLNTHIFHFFNPIEYRLALGRLQLCTESFLPAVPCLEHLFSIHSLRGSVKPDNHLNGFQNQNLRVGVRMSVPFPNSTDSAGSPAGTDVRDYTFPQLRKHRRTQPKECDAVSWKATIKTASPTVSALDTRPSQISPSPSNLPSTKYSDPWHLADFPPRPSPTEN